MGELHYKVLVTLNDGTFQEFEWELKGLDQTIEDVMVDKEEFILFKRDRANSEGLYTKYKEIQTLFNKRFIKRIDIIS